MEEIEGRIFVSIFTSSTITVFLRVFSFGCGNFFSFHVEKYAKDENGK